MHETRREEAITAALTGQASCCLLQSVPLSNHQPNMLPSVGSHRIYCTHSRHAVAMNI